MAGKAQIHRMGRLRGDAMINWEKAVLFAGLGAVALVACQKPDPVAIHRDKGDDLFAKDQYAAAAEEYALSLQADPKQDKLWEKKAVAHMRAGKLDEAAASLVKMLDNATTGKERAEINRKVAGMYLESKKPDEAEKYFLEALKADPQDTDSLAWLGEIASTRGGARAAQLAADPKQLEKAVAYYDQAIAIDPTAPIPYVNKRIALFKYMGHEQRLKLMADNQAKSTRDKATIEQAKVEMAQHQTREEDLKRQIDELGTKITELTKAAAAAKAAAASK
jgi:tetratricopeptide (TPR) repeat protein